MNSFIYIILVSSNFMTITYECSVFFSSVISVFLTASITNFIPILLQKWEFFYSCKESLLCCLIREFKLHVYGKRQIQVENFSK